MTERIISSECLTSIRQTCYEAGKKGREIYTVRAADGPEIVRCRDCKYGKALEYVGCIMLSWPEGVQKPKDPNGFCAWGERL